MSFRNKVALALLAMSMVPRHGKTDAINVDIPGRPRRGFRQIALSKSERRALRSGPSGQRRSEKRVKRAHQEMAAAASLVPRTVAGKSNSHARKRMQEKYRDERRLARTRGVMLDRVAR